MTITKLLTIKSLDRFTTLLGAYSFCVDSCFDLFGRSIRGEKFDGRCDHSLERRRYEIRP